MQTARQKHTYVNILYSRIVAGWLLCRHSLSKWVKISNHLLQNWKTTDLPMKRPPLIHKKLALKRELQATVG